MNMHKRSHVQSRLNNNALRTCLFSRLWSSMGEQRKRIMRTVLLSSTVLTGKNPEKTLHFCIDLSLLYLLREPTRLATENRDIRQRPSVFVQTPPEEESRARPRLNPLSAVINSSTIAQYHRPCTTTLCTHSGYSSTTPPDTDNSFALGDDGLDAQPQHIAPTHLASS